MHLASDYLHPIGGEARGKCRIRIFVPEAHDEERDRAVILCMELGPRKAPPHGRRHPLVHYPRLRRLSQDTAAIPQDDKHGRCVPAIACPVIRRAICGEVSPERGYVIHDRARATVAWVRRVPTPTRAEELMREHGVPWEGELLTHGLSPVPEEEGERQYKRAITFSFPPP